MRQLRQCRLWRAEEGVSTVEFAFVATILSMLLLGIFDFGRGYWEQMQVDNAARAGAEYVLRNGYNSANIQTTMSNAVNLTGMTISVPAPYCGCPDASSGVATQTCGSNCPSGDAPGNFVTVSAQVTYRTIFGWPGVSNPMTLASSVTVRIN